MGYDKLDSKELPKDWDHFTQSKSLALFVPSTMVRGEFNVLLNPRVIADYQVNVTTEPIDPRLLG